MKKVIAFLLLLCCTTVMAEPIKGLVFFGDSLSDNGNLYKVLLKILPKSPPYFKGRFSNGPTWAEHVGKHYYDKYYIDYSIYAYGGATAIYHQPSTKFIAPTNLSQEVNQYFLDAVTRDKSSTLYSIWIGGNDYLFDQQSDPDVLTSKVVDKISWAIITLMNHGAKYFLIMNMPDLARIPFAYVNNSSANLHTLSVLHNQKLAAAVKNIQAAHPEIKIVFIDVYNVLNDVIDNPQKYNQQYHTNITDTTAACWQGGFTLRRELLNQSLNQDPHKTYIEKYKHHYQRMNAQLANHLIKDSPFFFYLYSMEKASEAGIMPCKNAEEHIFWDDLHPTAIVHQIMSQIVLQELTKEIG